MHLITINDEPIVHPIHFRLPDVNIGKRYFTPIFLCGAGGTRLVTQYTYIKSCITCEKCLHTLRKETDGGHILSVKFLDNPFREYMLDKKKTLAEREALNSIIELHPIIDTDWLVRWHD